MTQPPILDFPDGLRTPSQADQAIWRYMPLPRFEEMARGSELYLPAACRFADDPFEGSVPAANRVLQDEIFRKFPVPPEWEERARNAYKQNKDWVYISSWYMSQRESAGMWKAYGAGGNAVVIKSNFERLVSALPSDLHVYGVEYIDYSKECIPDGHSLYPFFYKRVEYADERELRVLAEHFPQREARSIEGRHCCRVKIKLDDLVSEVRVCKNTQESERQRLSEALRAAGVGASVVPSIMSQEPRF